MSARYLVRFDDLNAASDWARWDDLERTLDDLGVRPIVAVVPKNTDPDLMIGPPDEDRLWETVRRLKAKGWAIGLHGYHHERLTTDGGLVGWGGLSEFAGVPAAEQARRIDRALEVFGSEDVDPDLWVAPAHAFDEATLEVLRSRGVTVLSDGFYPRAGRDDLGLLWVPQQLWAFAPRPFGTWTVCFHPDKWTPGEDDRFRADLSRYRDRIVGLDEVVAADGEHRIGAADRAAAAAYRRGLRLRHETGTRVRALVRR